MLTNDDSDALRASPEPQQHVEEAALNKHKIEKLRKKIPSSHFQDFMKSKGFGDHSKDINYQKFKDEFPGLVRIGRDYAAFSVFKVSEEGCLVVLTAGYCLNRHGEKVWGEKRYASGSFKKVKPAFLIKDGEVTKHVYYRQNFHNRNEIESFKKEVKFSRRYIKSKNHAGIVGHVFRGPKVTGVQPYLGDSLQDYMRKRIILDKKFKFKFDLKFLKNLFEKVVKELEILKGYVHGDLTPANMTFKEGSKGEVGLIDFGFADEVGSEFNLDTHYWSGCKYFDPFRLNGHCAASDVFTLALKMLTHRSFFDGRAEEFLTYICLKLNATMSLEDISELLVNHNASGDELIRKKLNESIASIERYQELAPDPMYKVMFNYLSISDVKALEGDKLKIVASLYKEGGFNSSALDNISSLKDDNLKIAVSLCEKYGFNSSVLGGISSLKDDNHKIAVSLYEKDDLNSSVLDNISRLKDDNLKIAVSLYKKDDLNSSVLYNISSLKDDNLKIAVSLYEKDDLNSSVLGNISRLEGDKLKIAASLYEKDGFNSSVLGNISSLGGDKLKIAASLCKEDGFNLENLTEISNLRHDRSAVAASLCKEGGFNLENLTEISNLGDDRLAVARSLCREEGFNSDALRRIARLDDGRPAIASSLCKEGGFNLENLTEISSLKDDNLKIAVSLYEVVGFNLENLTEISSLKDDNLKIAVSLYEVVGFNLENLTQISSLKDDNLKIAVSLYEVVGFNLENLTEISSLGGDKLEIAVSLYEKDGFNSSVLGNISSLGGDKLKIAASLCKEDGFNSSVLGNISRLEGDKLEIAALLCKEDGFNREVFNKIANLEDDCLKTELASLCELIRALGEYCKREDRHPAKNSAATEFQGELEAMMAEFISQPDLSTRKLEGVLTYLVGNLDPKTKNALFTNRVCQFSLCFWKISMKPWEKSQLGGLLSHFKIFSEENKRLEHAVSDYDYHNRMLNDPNDPNDYFSTEESFGR